MRTLRSIKLDFIKSVPAPSCDTRLIAVCDTRVIDTVNVEERVSASTGEKYTVIPNDISLFTQQQKLASFNPEIVKSIISEYSRSANPLTMQSEKLPDDKILDTIKSRYIQSTTDMANYQKYLQAAVRETLDDIEYERKQALESDSVSSSSSGSPSE